MEDAEERATQLDSIPTQDRGPLFGLPVSIKEAFCMRGCHSTAGLTPYLGLREYDCSAVAFLKKMGAVPFCQTNVPQTMYSLQTSNPIYGETGNPFDPDRECGGSTGGEGALIGAGGSFLGIGSDLGGSLRNPAAFCGVYSLRPTFGRHLTLAGTQGPIDVDPIAPPCVGGFLASSVDGLVHAHKTLYGRMRAVGDAFLAPMSFKDDLYESKKPLKIGYFTNYGIFKGHPSCERVVREAVEKLRSLGHKIIPFPAPDLRDVLATGFGLCAADRNVMVEEVIRADLPDSAVDGLMTHTHFMKWPRWLVKIYFWFINAFVTEMPLTRK